MNSGKTATVLGALAVIVIVSYWIRAGPGIDPHEDIKSTARLPSGSEALVTPDHANHPLSISPREPIAQPPEGESTEHLIKFSSPSQIPIPNVRLWLSQERVIGPSDDQGIVRYVPTGLPVRAWARATGYADHPLVVSEIDPLFRDVVLIEEGTITGTVFTPEHAPCAGVNIIAWDPSVAAPPGPFGGLKVATDTASRACTSSRDGSFRLEGLSPGRVYRLAAGGGGLASSSQLGPVKCPSAGVEVALCHLYAAVICAVDESDHLVSTDTRWISGELATIACKPLFDEARSIIGPQTLLAGLPREDAELIAGPWCWVFESPHDQDSLPAEVTLDLPGFEPVRERLDITALGNSLSIHRIQVRRSIEALGSLLIDFGQGNHPEGKLRIRRASGSESDTIVFRVRDRPTSVPAFNLPYGRYYCRYAASAGPFRFPAENEPDIEVEVGAEPSVFSVPPIATGAIEVVLTPPEAALWTRRIQCMIGDPPIEKPGVKSASSNPGTFSIDGPPYVISGIVPGTYGLYIMYPHTRQRVPDLVDVQANATSTFEVAIQ